MELTREIIESEDLFESMGISEERMDEMLDELIEIEKKGMKRKSDMLRAIITVADNPEELAMMIFDVATKLAKPDPMQMLHEMLQGKGGMGLPEIEK